MRIHVSVMIQPGGPPHAEVDSSAAGMEEMEAFWRRNRKALRRADRVAGPLFSDMGGFMVDIWEFP